jgi:arabinogalactan oligomer/maltooligosaccharide transport system substrate-binding protein
MQKFYDMTQEVPANEKTRTAVAKTDNELTSAVIEQYKDASPMPNIPEMTEVWTGAENMVINAASGKDTPKQAADKATKQIQQAIKQKYKE